MGVHGLEAANSENTALQLWPGWEPVSLCSCFFDSLAVDWMLSKRFAVSLCGAFLVCMFVSIVAFGSPASRSSKVAVSLHFFVIGWPSLCCQHLVCLYFVC